MNPVVYTMKTKNMRTLLVWIALVAAALATVTSALTMPQRTTTPRASRAPPVTKLHAATADAVEVSGGGDGGGTATIPNEVL